jgi:hypothetical protein
MRPLLAVAIILCVGCSRTDDGRLVVKRPASVSVKTTEDTLQMPKIGSHTDTVNTPVVGTQKDTVIVIKPVICTMKKAVQVPDVRKP